MPLSFPLFPFLYFLAGWNRRGESLRFAFTECVNLGVCRRGVTDRLCVNRINSSGITKVFGLYTFMGSGEGRWVRLLDVVRGILNACYVMGIADFWGRGRVF